MSVEVTGGREQITWSPCESFKHPEQQKTELGAWYGDRYQRLHVQGVLVSLKVLSWALPQRLEEDRCHYGTSAVLNEGGTGFLLSVKNIVKPTSGDG